MLKKNLGLNKKELAALIGIFTVVLIIWGVFLKGEPRLVGQPAGIFTQEELEILEPLKSRTITFGFSRGSELSFRYALKDLLKEELSIEAEFIRYETYEELEEAAINGEIDVLINMNDLSEHETLQWVSSPLTNTQFVITNKYSPLGEAINLQNAKVGFIEGTVLNQDLQETLGADNFETYFFSEVKTALDAIENQEIDAFVTRIDTVIEKLVNRKNLQIEFAFQNKILTGKFGTSNGEIFEALQIFEDILNSSRANAWTEKLYLNNVRHTENIINHYVQEKYADLIEAYEMIRVGMHNANFPFSFFAEDGTPMGVYIEMLDLFSMATGIQYEIQNSRENTQFEQLFDQLMNNEIQFLLGVAEEIQSPEVTRVGMLEQQDNIISIQKVGSNTEMRSLADLTFGIVTTNDFADRVLGIDDVVRFVEYEDAIEALSEGDIDILIGRETVLAYYRDVVGMTFLSQTSHINRLSSHSILGNVNNENINGLMAEIQRLYQLLYPGTQDKRWTNKAIDIHNKYNELRQQQQITYLIILGLMGAIFLSWMIRRELDTRKLKKANELDPLTKLYKKGVYEKKCKELIEQYPDKLGVFFFIDLDDFKSVNDTYGHEVGDLMIIRFAEILKRVEDKNPNTICFRIAGDEFGIFSIGYDTREDVEKLVVEMNRRVKGEIMGDVTYVLPIKYSAGGSIYNLDTTNFENLKKYADLAMYKAKKNKLMEGNNIALFDMMFLYETFKENITENLVETVLKGRQIYAVYQPIYALNNEDIYGYEGLSRTNNPNITNIVQLIELAEKADRAHELDIMMMEEVIRNFKGEGQLFINMMSKTEEAINEYLEKMVLTASEVNLPLENITLELSERTRWNEKTLNIIRKFKKRYKFLLAIDDFGVGFSNSALVLDAQPNIVKIDRYLIQQIHKNTGKYFFVKSFIELMKASQMKIACEGIEEEAELEILKTLGSDYGQGYYLGKPK